MNKIFQLPLEVKLLDEKTMKLEKIVNEDNTKIVARNLLNELKKVDNNIKSIKNLRGIYCFWWKDKIALNNVYFRVKGKKNDGDKHININFIKEYQKFKNGIPFYIGKTTDFKKRIGLHLSLGRKNWYDFKEKKGTWKEGMLLKVTTSCHLRAGVEHLFRNTKSVLNKTDTVKEMLNNISFSYIPIKSSNDTKKRFFYESLAIGYFKPWINIDSER